MKWWWEYYGWEADEANERFYFWRFVITVLLIVEFLYYHTRGCQ